MNLIYFKSDIGNFGDDLNPWLWEKLLGDFNLYPDNIDFVGIGSILDNTILSYGINDTSWNIAKITNKKLWS